jgi:hypothetical protein
MWTRKQLKEKGKASFKKAYWKCVLAALILAFIAGGSGGFSGMGTSLGQTFGNVSESNDDEKGSDTTVVVDGDDDESYDESVSVTFNSDLDTDGDGIIENEDGSFTVKSDGISDEDAVAIGVAFVVVVIVVTGVVIALAFVFDAFIVNTLELGCDRFFFKNLDEPANFSNIVHAFDHNYMNTVKTMFCKDIFTVLWSMLFIIPGIIKSYEYRMIPYILADNPDMDRKAVFALSKELMTGNKWKAFVLDLSFIGWELLSILTCGILSVFYVNPYIFSTNAALYEKLRYGNAAQ